jgi:hypothetical protein
MLSSPANNTHEKRCPAAQSQQLIEPGGLVVGSIEIHTVPMTAYASSGVWTPVGLQRLRFWLAGDGKCLKRFGGPGEIRTHDLFHAMEARSQLRHRPSRKCSCINFSTARGHRPLGGVRFAKTALRAPGFQTTRAAGRCHRPGMRSRACRPGLWAAAPRVFPGSRRSPPSARNNPSACGIARWDRARCPARALAKAERTALPPEIRSSPRTRRPRSETDPNSEVALPG